MKLFFSGSCLAAIFSFSITSLGQGVQIPPNHPNDVNHVECHSTVSTSDLIVDIVRTGDNQFSANFWQSRPERLQGSQLVDLDVGHFLIFDDTPQTSGKGKFHLFIHNPLSSGGARELDVIGLSGKTYAVNDGFDCTVESTVLPESGGSMSTEPH
ncbi:MAG: hypothetical protein C5B49_02920 [Bdellovibrio sp.]|nr:MAG: hypothetical protein C5B49_02920 [Bdellovibrio sp.]